MGLVNYNGIYLNWAIFVTPYVTANDRQQECKKLPTRVLEKYLCQVNLKLLLQKWEWQLIIQLLNFCVIIHNMIELLEVTIAAASKAANVFDGDNIGWADSLFVYIGDCTEFKHSWVCQTLCVSHLLEALAELFLSPLPSV